MERIDATDAEPDRAAALGHAIAGLVEDHTGRAPANTRTVVEEDLVLVMLGEVLTKAERELARAGDGHAIRRMHRRFHETMRTDLAGAVEAILGRRVSVSMFDSSLEPDLTCQLFVLEPRR